MNILYYVKTDGEPVSLRRAAFYSDLTPVYATAAIPTDSLHMAHTVGLVQHEDGFIEQQELRPIPEPAYSAELTRRAQARCKQLLLECDWTIGNDSPLTVENQQEWRAYRTFLRNINHQKGFPKVIDWGTPPEQVKKGRE
ncbi:phage tail assembly chaperone [Halodesulfovibrio sp.]|jgi:hypothetical protein|uniref:phage tail assembly chaperone n=1 Tax=Halodesulfovibrio sp. TaxID=1912772 RepID=UPI0025CD5D58|nr:phage tail assembly chaperone [Halodesulfovibrio sp.]MCT4626966.1 phage tail assembly chaperone [Halodesulfovibrio sp.]